MMKPTSRSSYLLRTNGLTRIATSNHTQQRSQQLTDFQRRNFYGLLYKIFVKRDKTLLKTPAQAAVQPTQTSEQQQENDFDPDEDPNIRAARDKYVQEQTRELLYSMKAETIPKGVKFSYLMMSFPLLCTTTYLGLLAPMVSAGTGLVDPASFAYLGRTCLRLLALNISFQGGIHYGLASATYETAVSEDELKHIRRQMIFTNYTKVFDLQLHPGGPLLLLSLPPPFLHPHNSPHSAPFLHWPDAYPATHFECRFEMCRERTRPQVVSTLSQCHIRPTDDTNECADGSLLYEDGLHAEEARQEQDQQHKDGTADGGHRFHRDGQ